jgi:hypothetical protein
LRVVIDARGKEARGSGEAKATVEATLRPTDAGTRVDVITDLAVTGKPAQFGRGLIVDVGRKLIGQFATALAADIDATKDGSAPTTPAPAELGSTRVPGPSADRPPVPAAATSNEIDVFGLVGDRVPTKLVLVLTALVVGWLFGRLTARSGRG